MQILQLGNGKFMTVERSWRDNGRDAEWAMIGGQRIRITERVPAPPEIFMNSDGFFYKDGKPVTDVTHVQHLTEPDRSRAIKFIEGEPKIAVTQLFESKDEAKASVLPGKRRGRPKNNAKAKGLVIEDEQSLREASGGVTV